MATATRRGVRKAKSLDLDDVFGGTGLSAETNLNKSDGSMSESESDAKAILNAARDFGDEGDMSDTGGSVSSTRSHARRGSRRRGVVDRTKTRSTDSLSALSKSLESGLFSYKDDGSDDDDETLLFGDSQKAAERKPSSRESNISARPAIAAIKKEMAVDRAKLRERMRRERSGAASSSPKRDRHTDKERSSEKERHADTERSTEKKERSSHKRRSTEKEKEKERSTHGRKEDSKYTEDAYPTAQPYRSKTEKKASAEPAYPTAQPYASKTDKLACAAAKKAKKAQEEKEEEAEAQEKAAKAKAKADKKAARKAREEEEREEEEAEEQEKAAKDKAKADRKAAKKASKKHSALDETIRHENLSPTKVKSSKRDLSPVSPVEEKKKEEKPRRKLVLRRPSLKGEQSPRSLTEETENSWAEEASRASTHQSGATDDSDNNSDDGTVLQFDPSQADNVYRVSQIQSEDSIYNIKNVDGKVVTGHIAEINPLGSENASEDDMVPSGGEESGSGSSSSSSSSSSEEEEEEDALVINSMPPLSGDEGMSPLSSDEELSPPSGDEGEDGQDNCNESVVRAPSGGEEESEKAPRQRKAPSRSKSVEEPPPHPDKKAPRERRTPGRSKSCDVSEHDDKAKKKKVRRKQVASDLEGPSDSDDSPQKPRRRLKKKGGNDDPPSIGDEELGPSEPTRLHRKPTMKPIKNIRPDGQPKEPSSPGAGLFTSKYADPPKVTEDDNESDSSAFTKQTKRMSMGVAIGRFFGSRKNTDAEESDDGSLSGSVHGGKFGRGSKKKHLLLGDSDSSDDDGSSPF